MEVWKIIFLSKWVICRFHVNLPGCLRGVKTNKKQTSIDIRLGQVQSENDVF